MIPPKKHQREVIGIIGGIGAYAGLHLFQNILHHTTAQTDQEHIPVLLASMGDVIGDRTAYLLGEIEENPAQQIAEQLLGLERMGATVAGIACNTAHSPQIFACIQHQLQLQHSRIRLLHIVEETIAQLRFRFPQVSRVGVIASTGTWQSNLYEHGLQSAGFACLKADPTFQQEVIHACIYDPQRGIKAESAPITPWARDQIKEILSYFLHQGAEGLILGCTEFSLAIECFQHPSISIIDSTQSLAMALIQSTRPEQLRIPPVPSLSIN